MSDLAEKMFGKVRKIIASGDYMPDLEKLSKPFESKDGIIYLFCKGCGSIYELPASRAAIYAEKAHVKLPETISDEFFECSGCQSCDGPRDQIELKTKKSILN